MNAKAITADAACDLLNRAAKKDGVLDADGEPLVYTAEEAELLVDFYGRILGFSHRLPAARAQAARAANGEKSLGRSPADRPPAQLSLPCAAPSILPDDRLLPTSASPAPSKRNLDTR